MSTTKSETPKLLYKETVSMEDRTKEAERILVKFPTRRPIIVEQLPKCLLPPMTKNKFLVPEDLTMGQFMYNVRKRIALKPSEAIFLFAGENIMSSSQTISQVYNDHKDTDGFLYLKLTTENTFG